MGVKEDVLTYLRTVPGVIDIMEMDEDTARAVWDIERSVKTKTQNDYKNVGYEYVMKRKHKVCVFFKSGFLFEKRTVLKLMTEDGTIMGTTLKPSEIPEYKDREDVIWISEDFVVFPMIQGKGAEAFVLFPYEVPEISDSVPGCLGPIGASPTTSSDLFLKSVRNLSVTDRIFTAVIGFDD